MRPLKAPAETYFFASLRNRFGAARPGLAELERPRCPIQYNNATNKGRSVWSGLCFRSEGDYCGLVAGATGLVAAGVVPAGLVAAGVVAGGLLAAVPAGFADGGGGATPDCAL
jgi:hypothetical protein